MGPNQQPNLQLNQLPNQQPNLQLNQLPNQPPNQQQNLQLNQLPNQPPNQQQSLQQNQLPNLPHRSNQQHLKLHPQNPFHLPQRHPLPQRNQQPPVQVTAAPQSTQHQGVELALSSAHSL